MAFYFRIKIACFRSNEVESKTVKHFRQKGGGCPQHSFISQNRETRQGLSQVLPGECPYQLDRSIPYQVDIQVASTTKYHSEASGVQQVVINVSDNTFVKIFLEDHADSIDRLTNVGTRSAGHDDSDGEDSSKSRGIDSPLELTLTLEEHCGAVTSYGRSGRLA